MKWNNKISEDIDMASFVDKIKKTDKGYAGISKLIQIIYWVLIPVYLLIIAEYIIMKNPFEEILGNIFCLIAFVIIILLFRQYYREYKYVDYSQSTLVMLKEVVYRYKPFQLKLLWVVLALIFLDAGFSLSLNIGLDFIWIQIIFWGVMILSMLVGLLIWYVRYKPIHDNALSLVREMEGC